MTTTEATHDTERRPLLGKMQSTYTDGPVTQPTAEEYSTDQGQSKDPLDEATRLAALKALPCQAPQEQLIIRIVCKDHFKDNDFPSMVQNAASPSDGSCNTPAIQALAALTIGRIRSLKYLSAIFTIGYFTSLSDRFGRKALIFLTLIPVLFTQALIVYMARPTVNLGMWMLYLDALFVGALGGGVLLGPSLNAYVVDCTPREGRSLVIGYVMVSLSLGQIFGPILGGFLISLTGDVTSAMTVSIIIQNILILYAIILPESLQKYTKPDIVSNLDPAAGYSKAEETSFLIKIKNSILAVLDPLLLFLPGRMDTSEDVNVSPSKYTLVTLIVAYGLLQFATTGAEVVLIPYTNLAFQWTAVEDDIYLTVQGTASFIVYVLVFPGLQKLYKRYIEKESRKTSDPSATITLSPSEIDQHVRDARDAEPEATEEAIRSTKPIEEEIRKKTDGSGDVPLDLSNLSRLQLQALCVKAGLDTTAENEELRKLLQEHWTQHHPSKDGDRPVVAIQGEDIYEPVGSSNAAKVGATDNDIGASVSSKCNVESVEDTELGEGIKQEEQTAECDNTATSVSNTEVKTEETGDTTMEDVSQSNTAIAADVFIKHEVVEESAVTSDSEKPFGIKQEQNDVAIKLEDGQTNTAVKMESTEEKVKVEDTVIPISHRKQFWEAKAASTRSGIPVNRDRPTGQNNTGTGARRVISQSRQTSQKRGRDAESAGASGDINDGDGHDGTSTNSLPTPGTVRSLIGKFAGSTISSSETPSSKRRKTEIVKSSPATSAAPIIPRYKRIIKIPVAGAASSKSPYALGANNVSKSTASAKRKLASSSPAGSPAPAPTKKTVSAETINRLATPKKINAPPALGAGAAPATSHISISIPAAPTRPRGPVLSTASRAAQRRNCEKK
ncbi:hypothetical protein BGZ80_010050 [Entomortierella chlamydospora]|uniref:Uncharacterized protein n=1 Tax=Entomortierella chlamydospora TaxID=101097 RepID=A0A9P6T3Z5_9FUNG|nr:hypothetical protein BGZ80_010050 [Entomortierella chlamydospora]